jgi:hypothetical protein
MSTDSSDAYAATAGGDERDLRRRPRHEQRRKIVLVSYSRPVTVCSRYPFY